MRKATSEQIARKREEIINACEQLYKTMSFREITLKEIGNLTPKEEVVYLKARNHYFEEMLETQIFLQTY